MGDKVIDLLANSKFDRMMKRLSHGCFHIGLIPSPSSTTVLSYVSASYWH